MKKAKKRINLKRFIFSFIGLSTAAFIFQACYGSPQDFEDDIRISCIVKSTKTKAPIPGIKVTNSYTESYSTTDTDGEFSIWVNRYNGFTLHLEDIDSAENGEYLALDTTFYSYEEADSCEIFLEEK